MRVLLMNLYIVMTKFFKIRKILWNSRMIKFPNFKMSNRQRSRNSKVKNLLRLFYKKNMMITAIQKKK